MKKHLAIAFMLSLLPTTVEAAPPKCGDREVIMTSLGSKYRERPVAIGIDNQGNVVEILASESGSWTMLITRPGYPTCVLGAGEAWEQLPQGENL